MAKMTITGMDELAIQLSRLGVRAIEISKDVVVAGAQPVADEIRKGLSGLPEDRFRQLKKGEIFEGVPKSQKQDLLDSLGITPPDIDFSGNTNVKVGFDGYGSFKSKKYKKGLPNQLLARSIESGSSVRKKTPFVRPAVNRSKKKALEAMERKFDEEMKKIMK